MDEPLPTLFLFDDEPVLSHHRDELKLISFSSAIASAAVTNSGPFNIGVFGNWGLGKTSVLRQVKSMIDQDSSRRHIVTAWVNAWKYEQEEHPIVPLIATIVDEIEVKIGLLNDEKYAKAKSLLGKGAKALKAIAYASSVKAKGKAFGLAEIEFGLSAKDAIEQYERLTSDKDPLLEQSVYKRAFEVLENFIPEKADGVNPLPKIVVFIDDLDRCLPDQALRLLESIKLVLSQRGFIFIMGVHRDVIDMYLQKRYHEKFGMDSLNDHGRLYLHKIIQLPLHLPSHDGRFENYIENLLHKDRPDSILLENSAPGARDVFLSMRGALAAGTNRNPRTLIRTLNQILFGRHLLKLTLEGGNPSKLEKFLSFATITSILEEAVGEILSRQLSRNKLLCSIFRDILKVRDIGSPLANCIPRDGVPDPFRPDADIEWDAAENEFDAALAAERYLRQNDSLFSLASHLAIQFDQKSFLKELLKTPLGLQWLHDEEGRLMVLQFLDASNNPAEDKDITHPQRLMEDAIRKKAGVPVGEEISESSKQLVKNLTISGAEGIDLTMLSEMENLRYLYLRNCIIYQQDAIRKLKRLLYLSLAGSEFENADFLSDLVNLRYLNISKTSIKDISFIKNFKKINRLVMFDSGVSDLSPLRYCNNLTTLNISDNIITNYESLFGLMKMKKIFMKNVIPAAIVNDVRSNMPWCDVLE